MARRNTIRLQENLEFRFAVRTWVTIGPAVLVGLLLCAGLAGLIFQPTVQGMLTMMGAGGVVMVICAIPGQFVWNRAFRSRILVPLREVGDVMGRAGEGDLTVRATIHHSVAAVAAATAIRNRR